MYFPVAGIEISPWLPPAVAFAISLFSSMAGVSGAFLLLPFQVGVLGFNGPAVSATNHLFNVLATPGGIWRYSREGRMLWPLALLITLGALPGVFAGALIRIHWLSGSENFQLFVAAVLFYLSGSLAFDLLRQEKTRDGQARAEARFHRPAADAECKSESGTQPRITLLRFDTRRLACEFCGETFDLSVPRLMLLSLIVGMVGGIYGIGGGVIIAPFLVTLFGIPVYIAAGAALLGTFVTSAAGVVFYQWLAPFHPEMAVAPDWLLGLLFGVGGMAGMYCGARLQKFVPARTVKAILALLILIPAFASARAALRGR